jgi:hypothetical protein
MLILYDTAPPRWLRRRRLRRRLYDRDRRRGGHRRARPDAFRRLAFARFEDGDEAFGGFLGGAGLVQVASGLVARAGEIVDDLRGQWAFRDARFGRRAAAGERGVTPLFGGEAREQAHDGLTAEVRREVAFGDALQGGQEARRSPSRRSASSMGRRYLG